MLSVRGRGQRGQDVLRYRCVIFLYELVARAFSRARAGPRGQAWPIVEADCGRGMQQEARARMCYRAGLGIREYFVRGNG